MAHNRSRATGGASVDSRTYERLDATAGDVILAMENLILAMKNVILVMKKLGIASHPRETRSAARISLGPSPATSGRGDGRRPLVTDGPFAETREHLGG